MTIPEYLLLMEAYRLKMVDQDYRIHQQAYLNFMAQGKEKTGKYKERPVYRTFRAFYDYEKEIRRAKEKPEEDDRFKGISKLKMFRHGKE